MSAGENRKIVSILLQRIREYEAQNEHDVDAFRIKAITSTQLDIRLANNQRRLVEEVKTCLEPSDKGPISSDKLLSQRC